VEGLRSDSTGRPERAEGTKEMNALVLIFFLKWSLTSLLQAEASDEGNILFFKYVSLSACDKTNNRPRLQSFLYLWLVTDCINFGRTVITTLSGETI